MDFELRPHTILMTVSGSRAYGIHTAQSDIDVKGVAVPPARYYHGCSFVFEQADKAGEIGVFTQDMTEDERVIVAGSKLEGSIYEVRKFLRLATDANPNILDVLFCRDEEIRLTTDLGLRLRESRELFISAKCKHTFSGYAAAQLKRIETHRRWLLHPPDHEPTRGEFGLPERTLIPADQIAAAQAALLAQVQSWDVDFALVDDASRIDLQNRIAASLAEQGITSDAQWRGAARAIGLDENFIELLDRERRYKNARNQWDQYHHWKKNRNPDRAALEEKHGFDAKHGAHLFRLLKMCREILTTGKVNVWRGDIDADEIRGIRAGAWPYDKLVEWAKAEDASLEEMYRKKEYTIPRTPDRAAIETLCMDIVEDALRSRRDGHG